MRAPSSASARRSRSSTCGSAHGRQQPIPDLLQERADEAVGIFGATENFAVVSFAQLEIGRFFVPAEVEHRRQVVVLGNEPYQSLFPNVDPIGKKVRIGANEFTVIGVLGKRPSMGGLDSGADDFAVIPFTRRTRSSTARFRRARRRSSRNQLQPDSFRTAMIAVVPREDACASRRCGKSRSLCASATVSTSTSRTTSTW